MVTFRCATSYAFLIYRDAISLMLPICRDAISLIPPLCCVVDPSVMLRRLSLGFAAWRIEGDRSHFVQEFPNLPNLGQGEQFYSCSFLSTLTDTLEP